MAALLRLHRHYCGTAAMSVNERGHSDGAKRYSGVNQWCQSLIEVNH
jgi:hypothetical protein